MPVITFLSPRGRRRDRDALGSVVATYKDGWLTADRSYDPYGETRAEWNDVGRFGWVGGLGYRETRREWVSHYVRARHYGYPMGMWTSVDPLWPSEPAFGYVGGQATLGADPSGKALSFEGDCPPDFVRKVARLCAAIKKLTARQQRALATCVERAATASKQECPGFKNSTAFCLANFCYRGTVICRERGPEDPYGMCLNYSGEFRRISPDDQVLITTPFGGSNFASISGGPLSGSQGQLTFLHEIAHSCGVGHGKYGDRSNIQCNDIYACCLMQVLKGLDHNLCADAIGRYQQRKK